MSIDRAEYIAALRKVADILEDNPQLRLPYQDSFTFHFLSDGSGAVPNMVEAAKCFGIDFEKRPWDNYFDLDGFVGPIKIQLSSMRDDVCKRVVTGRREIVEPEVIYTATGNMVTRIEEDVDWVCPDSLLALAKEKESSDA